MKNLTKILAAATIAIVGYSTQATAATTTIDFDSLAVNTIITGDDLGGVIITAGGDDVYVTNTDPASTGGNVIRKDPFTGEPYRADFTVSGVTDVSVDLGDFNGDSDDLFLSVYDSSDNLLSTVSLLIPFDATNLFTLSVSSGTEIAYAIFGSIGRFSNSIFADNLTFTTSSISAVPLPASMPLILGGLGLMGFFGRRKKKAA